MSIKISFMQLQKLHYVNKSKVTSSFQGICIVCIFWLLFSIHYQCQLVKGEFSQYLGGGGLQPPHPLVSLGLDTLNKKLIWTDWR